MNSSKSLWSARYMAQLLKNPPFKNPRSAPENDAGFHFSTKFGFGVMDAEAFISHAKH